VKAKKKMYCGSVKLKPIPRRSELGDRRVPCLKRRFYSTNKIHGTNPDYYSTFDASSTKRENATRGEAVRTKASIYREHGRTVSIL
jgi:hypothetical protein